jgi:hypothetical protein
MLPNLGTNEAFPFRAIAETQTQFHSGPFFAKQSEPFYITFVHADHTAIVSHKHTFILNHLLRNMFSAQSGT